MPKKVRRAVQKLVLATARMFKSAKDRFELSVDSLPEAAHELPELENPLLKHKPISAGSAHSYRQPRFSLLNPDERPITADSIFSSTFDQENNIRYDSDDLDFFPDPLPKGPLRVCNPDSRPTSSDSAFSTPPHPVNGIPIDDEIHPVRFQLLVTEPEQDDRSASELPPQPTLRDSSLPIIDNLRLQVPLEGRLVRARRLIPPQTRRSNSPHFPTAYRIVPRTDYPHGKLAEDARVAKYAARVDEIRAKLRRRSRAPLPIRRLPIKFKFQPIELPRISFPLFPGPPTFAAAGGAAVQGAERAVDRTNTVAYRKQQRLKRLRFSGWLKGKELLRVMRQRLRETLNFEKFEVRF